MADERNFQPDAAQMTAALAGFQRASAWVAPEGRGPLDAARLRQWARLIGGTTALCLLGLRVSDHTGGELLPLLLAVVLLGLYFLHLGIDPSSLSTRWTAQADAEGFTLCSRGDERRVPWALVAAVERQADGAEVQLTEGEPAHIPAHRAFARLVAAAERVVVRRG